MNCLAKLQPDFSTLFAAPTPSGRGVRILRVITRLNIGGPAIHVTTLTAALRERGYDAVLASGECEPGEADMRYLLGPEDRAFWASTPSSKERPRTDQR
jgi:hypothetical protein